LNICNKISHIQFRPTFHSSKFSGPLARIILAEINRNRPPRPCTVQSFQFTARSMSQPISKRPRGRPKGSTGKAAVLSPEQIERVLRVAGAQGRYADRATLALSLSIHLGLRAKELARLKWADVYDEVGRVRGAIHLTNLHASAVRSHVTIPYGGEIRSILIDYGERHRPWCGEASLRPLFTSQRGNHLTTASMARFLTEVYRKAGISRGSSRSGRQTRVNWLLEIGVDVRSISRFRSSQ
jgi:integrase/recombinase XerD